MGKSVQTELLDNLANEQIAPIGQNNGQNNNSNLERNFLKLKELYDTLYKANLALMNDQKDLEGKYSKLLKAYNKQN
jgi:hypothetical protein